MVKAKECCCGCTLRQGTLILLWIVLVLSCIGILIFLPGFIYGSSAAAVTIHNLYFLMFCIVGATVSFQGLYAIQKNMPQYLTPSYYYLFYEVIYGGVVMLVLIIYPSLYSKVTITASSYQILNSTPPTNVLVIFVAYSFLLALLAYLAIVVKSLRDSMIKQKYSGGDTQIPVDPSALGYGEA